MTFTFVLPEFSSPLAALWWIFTHGGFIVLLIAIGYGVFWLYMDAIQERYTAKQKYILLAVDVPRENEQTPKAVEHIFSHFHGIQRSPNFTEKYFDGYVQPTITVEMVSIDGYIQYLVRCLVEHRDLAESAIYAQYPQAEISEVEDYSFEVPTKYPDEEWDLWACEMALTNKDEFPLKTYPLWEHPMTQTFLDPMASLLEIMSRLHQGEQIWLQWVLTPLGDNSWREKGIKTINKLAGIPTKSKPSALGALAEIPGTLLTGTYDTLTRTLYEPGEGGAKKEERKDKSNLQHLTADTLNVIQAIGIKISKLGFSVKGRFVYIAKKEQLDKSRIGGVFGALKQYASLDMNGLRPDKKMKTKVDYWRVAQREAELKRRLILGYRNRSTWSGRSKFVLNIEELASIWHFPVLTVKAPSVKKSEAKRGEPPSLLPVGELEEYRPKEKEERAESVVVTPTAPATASQAQTPPEATPPPAEPTTKGAAPSNLPIA